MGSVVETCRGMPQVDDEDSGHCARVDKHCDFGIHSSVLQARFLAVEMLTVPAQLH